MYPSCATLDTPWAFDNCLSSLTLWLPFCLIWSRCSTFVDTSRPILPAAPPTLDSLYRSSESLKQATLAMVAHSNRVTPVPRLLGAKFSQTDCPSTWERDAHRRFHNRFPRAVHFTVFPFPLQAGLQWLRVAQSYFFVSKLSTELRAQVQLACMYLEGTGPSKSYHSKAWT
ncbi:hypothetical protein EDC04DRAFT_1681623 [Pisolithus marmoratus]|nr:hypothetical protein EDC04DRAFT_1681623 [Pisolithus marmoratus]